jgi:hypothetical protein
VARPEALTVHVAVPGERWEIEFTEAGEVEIEIFRSDGHIYGSGNLDDPFARFSN